MITPGGGGYKFGETNLGPEHENLAPPNDQYLAMQTAQEFLGEERYPDHNRRMIELLDKFGLSTPGLEMAVILHDVVDHGLINPEDESTERKAQEIIYKLWDNVEDKGQLSYALGCALSAGYVEDEVGESWRYAGLDSYSGRPIEEQSQLRAAIEKDDTVEIDPEVLKSAGLYELDTTSLRHAATTRDVEGFILKGIELLDNLDNPPANNHASVWRDCIEVFNCYSPALTFFGFKKLATELRGKALEFHHGGTEAFVSASKQHELSTRHFNQINTIFDYALEETLIQLDEERNEKILAGNIPELKGKVRHEDLDVDGRIKTVGSAAKKLLSDKYKSAGVELLPDGIGYRIIVPDSIGGKGAILVGDKMKQMIQSGKFTDAGGKEISIRVEHPHPDELAEEDLINKPREGSQYRSYHVVFACQIGEDKVPFEIQTVTQEQEWLHTWSASSEVLRKTDSEPLASRLDDMGHMGRRSEHLKNKPLNRELIPNTWLDLVNLLPDLKSPVHESYSLIDNGVARIMSPHELKKLLSSELDGKGLNDDIFLPPTELSQDDFKWMISQIDPSLGEDEQIQEALELLMQQDLPIRDNGLDKLEGHLLPAAFHAGIMAVLSSKHWESKNPSKFLSDTVTAALLHDILEDADKSEREEMKVTIRFKFGDKVADTVEAMSSLNEIEDDHARRTAHASQLEESAEALIIKVSDNLQNHVTDLAYLAKYEPVSHKLEEIKSYFIKTHRYLSPLFESGRIPDEYRQAHKVIMNLGKKLFPKLLSQEA